MVGGVWTIRGESVLVRFDGAGLDIEPRLLGDRIAESWAEGPLVTPTGPRLALDDPAAPFVAALNAIYETFGNVELTITGEPPRLTSDLPRGVVA